jgi:hypothetical protein
MTQSSKGATSLTSTERERRTQRTTDPFSLPKNVPAFGVLTGKTLTVVAADDDEEEGLLIMVTESLEVVKNVPNISSELVELGIDVVVPG